jgi:hypothetical protein
MLTSSTKYYLLVVLDNKMKEKASHNKNFVSVFWLYKWERN